KKIWDLNLEPIMIKLMHPEEGSGWNREQTLFAIEEYRRFLFLTVTRHESIIPKKYVDEVWHAHILDTEKYAFDCNQTFEFFLHHFPYLGMRGDEDKQLLTKSFSISAYIYEAEFKSPYLTNFDNNIASMCDGGSDGSSCDNEYAGSINLPDANYATILAAMRPSLNSL
ncbi:MAG: hypothetical protein M3Q64_02205, partial [bacterium]|nr:hypothetical protein [bacterium]